MKIISKFKDYYDYLQGIYGVDEKLVLDRTDFAPFSYNPSSNGGQSIYIGEYHIQAYWRESVIYWGEEIEQFSYKPRWYETKDIDKNLFYFVNDKWGNRIRILRNRLYMGDECPTWKENCPILIHTIQGSYDKNPILKQYSVNNFISAHDVWIMISDWLSKRITKNEKPVPIGDDKLRVQSHGFDLKTSFRHRK